MEVPMISRDAQPRPTLPDIKRKEAVPGLSGLGTPPVWRVDRTESLGRSSILRRSESCELKAIEILQLHCTGLECSA